MAPVRVARAFRLPIIAAMTALALSGCMHSTALKTLCMIHTKSGSENVS